jgi:chemotaxis protein CheD
MSVGTKRRKKTEELVGMAQIVMTSGDEPARSVLGSCIGLVLHDQKLQIAAVAHIVLPSSCGRSGPPGKFADTAIPYMLDQLARKGAGRSKLVAKVVGGASMFSASGPIQIGEANYAAVKELLAASRIPIIAEHVGGGKGRRITFVPNTGELTVETAGDPTVVI